MTSEERAQAAKFAATMSDLAAHIAINTADLEKLKKQINELIEITGGNIQELDKPDGPITFGTDGVGTLSAKESEKAVENF